MLFVKMFLFLTDLPHLLILL